MTTDYFYITGCDTGFGRNVVERLSKMKKHVFAGHYVKENGQKLEEIGNGFITAVHLDVGSEESVTSAAEIITAHLKEKNGRLRGVVNNAGIASKCGFAETISMKTHTEVLNINYLGTVRVILSVLPLIRQSEGRIVNVASIAGRFAFPFLSAYSASKYAVEGFSDAIRRELAQFGVSVHLVEPGVFGNTSIWGPLYSGFMENFNNSSDEIQQAYGADFIEAAKKDFSWSFDLLNNKDINRVTDCYIHALTSSSPHHRYHPGFDSSYVIPVVSHLNELFGDLGFLLPIFKSPASKPQSALVRSLFRYSSSPLLKKIVCLVVGYFIYKHVNKFYVKN